MIIPYFIQFIFLAILTSFVSMIIHELGHFIYFKKVIGKNVEIRFLQDDDGRYKFKVGYKTQYRSINKKQLAQMYLSGVVAGMIPIFVISLINGFYFIVFAPYLWGCIPDFKELYKLGKK